MSDEMKPGRELDALIAEKVMNFPSPRQEGIDQTEYERRRRVILSSPEYSYDIAAAWEVVVQLEKLGWLIRILSDFDIMNDRIIRRVSLVFAGKREIFVTFKTLKEAPLAICLAALKVVEK